MATQTDIYRRLHDTGHYGGNHYEPVLCTIERILKGRSLLDVGCGSGRLVRFQRKFGVQRAVGCDIAPREPWIDRAELPVLPYGNGEFALVTCFDVLEHLPEYQVGSAIDELRRVAQDRIIVSVASSSDRRDVPGLGEVELHLTQRPADWWLGQLGDATPIPIAPFWCNPPWRHYFEVMP